MASRSNAYEWIEAEILAKIIGPKIHLTIQIREPSSRAELIKFMEEDYNMAGVTAARMNDWLEALGYELKQRVMFERPGTASDMFVEPSMDHEEGGSFSIVPDDGPNHTHYRRPPQVPGVGGIIPSTPPTD